MKKKFAIIALALAIIVVVAGVIILLIIQNGNEYKPFIRTGQVEMREYDVSSKLPGRIEWIKFDEGDSVTKGDQLVKLTDREMKAKFFQAEGGVQSAQAQMNMLIAGARKQEIEMANRMLDAAESQFDLAQVTYNRMKSLFDEKLLSSQELDVVFQKLSAAKAQKEAAKSQLDMAIEGSRTEQKDMARGQLNRAKQTLEEVSSYLDESIILSPVDGIIAKRYVDNGELVATGYPVLTVIDTKDVWVELNLPALELEKVKIGDILTGKIDGLGISKKFKIVNFAAMSDFANWRNTNDKATFEVRSFTVKLTPLEHGINSIRPGMTVRFDLNKISRN